jgi:hypothetical protein
MMRVYAKNNLTSFIKIMCVDYSCDVPNWPLPFAAKFPENPKGFVLVATP